MVSVESHGLQTLLAGPMTSSAELRIVCEEEIPRNACRHLYVVTDSGCHPLSW